MSQRVDQRTASELARYRDVDVVHDLPETSHFWSASFLDPKLEACGFAGLTQFFDDQLEEVARRAGRLRAVSLGAGNCDFEVGLARTLRDRGVTDFEIECVDLNPEMLDRGRRMAADTGVGQHLTTVCCRAEEWRSETPVDVVLANQSLHHFVELEEIFDRVGASLHPGGRFLISDMIGRNGHRLWPEARLYVEAIWDQLPLRYKLNRQLDRFEPVFVDWDCSQEGYEGIRAEDILPLLLRRFHFALLVCFANIADPFVGRAFGHNFDMTDPFDRGLIEEIGRLDDELLDRGVVKPTHMVAALTNERPEAPVQYRHWSPAFCLRDPSDDGDPPEIDWSALRGVFGHLARGPVPVPAHSAGNDLARQIWNSKPWRLYLWLGRLKRRWLR